MLGGTGGAPLESPLVVGEAQSLVGGEGVAAAEEAHRDSPEAVVAREESQTKFDHLDREQAAKLAAEVFPKLVDDPAGGPPRLPDGQKLTGFVSDQAATVELGNGQKGLIESSQPMAMETSTGPAPIDLGLSASEGGFHPTFAPVQASIPDHLSQGVALPGIGVSLTPVDETGAPLGGSEGVIDGASVLYANTQTAMDSLIKPTTDGFSADTLLRSAESPHELYYRVGLPPNASLRQPVRGGPVQIEKEGITIALVMAPSAQDAAGASVPVSMSVAGDMITLAVGEESGEYQFPVEVDPEISDKQLTATSGGKPSNWESSATSGRFTNEATTTGYLRTSGSSHTTGEYALWGYQTQGVSDIWEVVSESEAKNKEAGIESILELEAHGGAQETKLLLSAEAAKTSEYARKADELLCPKAGCSPGNGGQGNAVHYQQNAVTTMEGKAFSDTLYEGIVELSEPAGTHSTTSYNTSTPTFEVEVENEGKKEKQSRANALYGAGSWLSNYQGALKLIANDNGIGVSATKLEYESAANKWTPLLEHNYLEENKCKGGACHHPEHAEYWTLNDALLNGEDKIRYRAEEAMPETKSGETEGVVMVKVDKSPPHGLRIEGLPYGNELSQRPYKLTVEATDGLGATIPSSGVKSIQFEVDKHLLTKVGGTGECTTAKGECTASEEFTINGAELGAGHHAIVVAAKDNAGNEAKTTDARSSVRHSHPTMGPGSVDLESGDFGALVRLTCPWLRADGLAVRQLARSSRAPKGHLARSGAWPSAAPSP